MKNTNITNKYMLAIGTLLIAAVFSVALPISVLADDFGNPIDISTGNPIDISTGNPIDISTGNPIISGRVIYPVSSGSVIYGGGYYGSYPVYSYPISTVSSGGFTGGTVYPVTGPAPITGSVVTSGSVSGLYNSLGTLNGSCSASFNTGINGGPTVTWTGSAFGGNGVYSYYWTGDESLSGSGQYISKTYISNGVKNAYLTITSSDGQTVTRNCSATVGNGNQVLAYTATNPNLQSVYLSNVPYTGAGDTAKVIGFISVLLLWSAGLSYMFLKRKEQENAVVASVAVTNAGDNAKMFEKFSMEINSDNQAIESIETFARMNQVLLSSDAVKELAKLSRLNRVKPREVIEKMSTGEWTTVGEADLQKYL